MIYFVIDNLEEPEVPNIAIHFLLVQITMVLLMFINFVFFFINGFWIENILSQAANSSLHAVKAMAIGFDIALEHEFQPEIPHHAFKF